MHENKPSMIHVIPSVGVPNNVLLLVGFNILDKIARAKLFDFRALELGSQTFLSKTTSLWRP